MTKDLSAVKKNINNPVIQDHHLFKKHLTYFPNRLNSKEIYNLGISQREEITYSILYYQENCNDNNFSWKNIHLLKCLVT